MARAWGLLAPRVAPAALALAALHQIHLARSEFLCPWKGGGFGMFATSDRSGARDVRAYAVGPRGERRIRIPDELDDLRARARDLPSQANLAELAARILAGERGAEARLAAVRVEVGLTALDLEHHAPQRRVLREAVARWQP
jgi:hypothetical protein